MPRPRLSIRTFLVLCLLLGAVAIPVGWRSYQKWKAAEIERLEKELAEAWQEEPSDFLRVQTTSPFPGTTSWVYLPGSPPNPAHVKWKQRIKTMEDRLEKLTGVRPEPPARPGPQIEAIF